MPTTHRIPFAVVTLPDGDFFETGARVDRRPVDRRSGETRRVRPELRVAVNPQ